MPSLMRPIMGSELASMARANFIKTSDELVTIKGGPLVMGVINPYDVPEREVEVATFRMTRNSATNEQYGRFVDSLGTRRFALVGKNIKTRLEEVFALGSSETEVVESVLVKRPVRELLPEIQDIVTMGGVETFEKIMKVVAIKDHTPPKHLGRPNQPAVAVDWYSAFVYNYMHGLLLPTAEQWEYAARVVEGEEELRDYATPSKQLTKMEVRYMADSTVDVNAPPFPTLENGLRHLAGNAREWLRDDGEDGFKKTGGGSYVDSDPIIFHAAVSQSARPGIRYDHISFRGVAP